MPARRSRPRAKGARVHPGTGRDSQEPSVHEVLHGPARPVAVAADGADPARARPAPAFVAVLDLQLRVLGAADVRRARGRAVAAPGAAVGRRPARDRRAARARRGRPAAERSAPARASRRRALDPRAAGGRRLVGRDPAAVGVGDHRAHRARLRARRPDARQGRRGLAGVHGRRRRAAAARGVPVAGLGHGARALLALRACGVPADHPELRPRRRVSPPRGGDASRATGRSAAPTSLPAAGRSSTRTTTTPTSTTRPSSRSPSTGWESARRTRSRAASTGSSACSRGTAAGAPSTSTTRRCGSTRSRSATSAR